MLKSDEDDIVFKIPWGINRERLKYDPVRKVVKKTYWSCP
jgi:hypothetical protein